MTLVIDDIPIRVDYSVGGSAEDEFDVPFAFFADEDLEVYVDDVLLTLNVDYTVAGRGTSDAGLRTVTLTVAVSNAEVAIVREIEVSRTTDIPEAGPFSIPDLNLEFDRMVAMLQQFVTRIARGIRQPNSDADDLDELPAAADRANKFVAFDADGQIIAAAGTSANLGPVSTFVDTLLSLASRLLFKQALYLDTHGADIASATTINLDNATGDLVDVTGTTTITTITLAEGVEKTVRFTGILTLTHGSSLVLPTGASITTAAGDFAVFRGYAAGVVRCVDYSRANGESVASTAVTPGLVFISSTAASGAAELEIAAGLSSTYDQYVVELYAKPSTDNQPLYLTLSQDAGGSYLNSNYRWILGILDTVPGHTPAGSASDSQIQLSGSVGNGSNETLALQLRISRPAVSSVFKMFSWTATYIEGTPALLGIEGHGTYVGNGNAIDAIKFAFASGNITGTAKLYGVRK